MTEEEKKRRPLVHHIRKQSASKSELPASQRRHAAGLSSRAQGERHGEKTPTNNQDSRQRRRVSFDSNTGRPAPKDHK
ncbi:hypothetical protein, partial [Oenococcus oeni]